MIPILFEIGPIKIYSYGLMLGIAFLTGNYILAGELKKRSINPELASTITLLAVVFGLLGAKLLHLIENWNEFIKENKNKMLTKVNINISCSSGTYIRRIASDLGEKLNSGAFTYSIKRIKVGGVEKKDCIKLEI